MANAGGSGAILLIASLLVAVSCTSPATTDLLLASTTSTEDSGLFEVLLPAFHREFPGIRVRVIAGGSGQALELGRRGDADVLLVHAPEDEAAFMAAGLGRSREPVMYNHFVIVGPPADPARVRAAPDAATALRRIAGSEASFVSRGDDSGTHRRELSLWRAAGWTDARPGAPGRVEAGQGMGETLILTSERQAYTLSDRGTWLAMADVLRLELLLEGSDALVNPYSVITTARARHPAAADTFAAWLVSAAAARIIASFGVDRFGEPLFQPGAPGR